MGVIVDKKKMDGGWWMVDGGWQIMDDELITPKFNGLNFKVN